MKTHAFTVTKIGNKAKKEGIAEAYQHSFPISWETSACWDSGENCHEAINPWPKNSRDSGENCHEAINHDPKTPDIQPISIRSSSNLFNNSSSMSKIRTWKSKTRGGGKERRVGWGRGWLWERGHKYSAIQLWNLLDAKQTDASGGLLINKVTHGIQNPKIPNRINPQKPQTPRTLNQLCRQNTPLKYHTSWNIKYPIPQTPTS